MKNKFSKIQQIQSHVPVCTACILTNVIDVSNAFWCIFSYGTKTRIFLTLLHLQSVSWEMVEDIANKASPELFCNKVAIWGHQRLLWP